MKYFYFLLLTLWLSNAKAQKITGLWYSGDSTRIYEIKSSGTDEYSAIIKSSSRRNDSVGYCAIKNLKFNARKKRYEGIIYSVADNKPTGVKIKFGKDPDKIILKLNRMFIMNVTIYWKRVAG